MMKEDQKIIVVRIARDEAGLYFATSDDLEGVHVAHRDPYKIIDDLPNVIRLWYKRRNKDVTVFRGPVEHYDHHYSVPAMTVPAEIAAAALAR
jgi:hypothetical protein